MWITTSQFCTIHATTWNLLLGISTHAAYHIRSKIIISKDPGATTDLRATLKAEVHVTPWLSKMSVTQWLLTTYNLMDEVKQNIEICHWWADQLFVEAESLGK